MKTNIQHITSVSDFSHKKIALYGYGIEGQITHKFLQKYVIGAKVAIFLDEENLSALEQIVNFAPDFVIISSGIKRDNFPLPYTTATNIFFDLVPKKQIIGITGSKGKSSTSLMLYKVLQTKYAHKVKLLNLTNSGNELYAPPLLQSLIDGVKTDELFVCELSSFQLFDLQHSPHIALVTSLFDEHLNWHIDRLDYFAAKGNIIRFQNHDDYLICSAETFEKSQWSIFYQGNLLIPEKSINNYSSPSFTSLSLTQNASLVGKTAQLLAFTNDEIKQGFNQFQPLAHRQQVLGIFDQITFVDDGASSAPEATIDALNTFPNTNTLILGGQDRSFDYSRLVEKISSSKIKNLVLFPNTGQKIMQLIIAKNLQSLFNILETNSMQAAVNFAFDHTKKGSICLLSSGAPSYSLWKNWDEKGKEFFTAIKNYAKE